MIDSRFRKFFNEYAYTKLKHRGDSFQYIFEYLYSKNRPVFIVETGCTRIKDNWEGDGQSTVLFDKFAQDILGSLVLSVDVDPNATSLCKALVSECVKIHTGNSIPFLRDLAKSKQENFDYIDLLYLDSYDVDMKNVHPSALHHMKELVSIKQFIGPETLIVIDDSPTNSVPMFDGDVVKTVNNVVGKGKYIAEYANDIGVSPVFSMYQIGFIGF
jgi:hypothetical protein